MVLGFDNLSREKNSFKNRHNISLINEGYFRLLRTTI